MKSHQYDFEDQSIRRSLMRFRFDREFRGDAGRVPIRAFATFVGVTPQTLYYYMAPEPVFTLRPSTRARLRHGITLVLEHGLRWKRRGQVWHPALPDGSLPAPPPIESRRHGHQNLLMP